ncbi:MULTISPECIES: hypothetical protein [Micrococcaceae]|uniref:hypothetical protein n=1 Tax=Micrococcaceae TaxID=1268 RepID=UPI00336BE398
MKSEEQCCAQGEQVHFAGVGHTGISHYQEPAAMKRGDEVIAQWGQAPDKHRADHGKSTA